MASPLIKAENISKAYKMSRENVVYALKEASFEVEEGDFVAISGPSGSGKSTHLHLIGLLDTPSTGKIIMDSQGISQLSMRALARIRRQKIGFIFQMFNLMPRITVYKNVLLPLIYSRYDRRKRKERALEVIREVGLENRAKHKPNRGDLRYE